MKLEVKKKLNFTLTETVKKAFTMWRYFGDRHLEGETCVRSRNRTCTGTSGHRICAPEFVKGKCWLEAVECAFSHNAWEKNQSCF